MYKTCAIFIFAVHFVRVYAQNIDNQASPIIFDTSNIANGQYSFKYETPDDIKREESGGFDSNGNYVVKGYYSYINDLNQQVSYAYVADKDGYRVDSKPVETDRETTPQPEYPIVVAAPPPQIIAGLLG